MLFLRKDPEEKKKQLYLLPAEGGEAQKLTEVEGGVHSAGWSPDGKRIVFRAFAGRDPDWEPKLGQGKALAEDVELIQRSLWRLNGMGSWREKHLHLFTIPVKGGRVKQLTRGGWNVGGAFLGQETFTFSLDGKRVYYIATPDAEDDWKAARNSDLHVIELDGTRSRRLTDFPGMILAVRMSPTGELIIIGNDREFGWASPNRLWRVDPKSGKHQLIPVAHDLSLADTINCDVKFPSRIHEPWISQDGLRGRVRLTVGGLVRLSEVDLSTGDLEWLSSEDYSVIAWHCPPTGEIRAEVRTSFVEMPELHVVDRAGRERKLTRLNDRLLASRKVFPSTPVGFKASDGKTIDAWLIRPGGSSKRGWPLVLGIHGGPKTVYGNAFFLEFQMLAGAGMGVLYGNPRGSDGYGTEFALAVQGRYGERDYQDLMESIDQVLQLDLGIDPARLGVSGGSYGGFMTNWIVGHTDRFQAAVSQRGISNWTSFFGTSDIGYFFNPEHVGALPWEDLQKYVEKSPLTYADKVKTPLLLIHSEQDLRCPIEQSEQLFIYLRRLGHEVMLARFPSETHELSRSGSPKRRMERLRLIVEWFKEKLL